MAFRKRRPKINPASVLACGEPKRQLYESLVELAQVRKHGCAAGADESAAVVISCPTRFERAVRDRFHLQALWCGSSASVGTH